MKKINIVISKNSIRGYRHNILLTLIFDVLLTCRYEATLELNKFRVIINTQLPLEDIKIFIGYILKDHEANFLEYIQISYAEENP